MHYIWNLFLLLIGFSFILIAFAYLTCFVMLDFINDTFSISITTVKSQFLDLYLISIVTCLVKYQNCYFLIFHLKCLQLITMKAKEKSYTNHYFLLTIIFLLLIILRFKLSINLYNHFFVNWFRFFIFWLYYFGLILIHNIMMIKYLAILYQNLR